MTKNDRISVIGEIGFDLFTKEFKSTFNEQSERLLQSSEINQTNEINENYNKLNTITFNTFNNFDETVYAKELSEMLGITNTSKIKTPYNHPTLTFKPIECIQNNGSFPAFKKK